MNDYKDILVVIDPDKPRNMALVRGEALARQCGATLHLLLVDYNGALFRARFLDPALLRKAISGHMAARRRWLEGEIGKLASDGLVVKGEVVWHRHDYEAIARHAARLNPDLVIKEATRVEGLDRLLGTPEDRHLIRLCPAPLMLVSALGSTVPKIILAAVDPFDTHEKPSSLNDTVLKASLQMAYAADAVVHVAHAYEYLPAATPVGAEMVLADVGVFEQVREDHRKEFIRFGETHSIPEDRMHLKEGEPAHVISKLAADMAVDLVVLGTVQRSGLKRVLMGATAESILAGLRCDVLVLKPEGFAKALDDELAVTDEESQLPEPWKDFRDFSL